MLIIGSSKGRDDKAKQHSGTDVPGEVWTLKNSLAAVYRSGGLPL